jgi:shikimate kinase
VTAVLLVTGLMGAGKSTAAAHLAARLGWALSDSDTMIEAATGATAAQLARAFGADHLHDLEAQHLLDAVAGPTPVVAAVAASVIEHPRCREALMATPVVWLDAPVAVLVQRFSSGPHRPQYGSDLLVSLTGQAARRSELFAAVANWTVDAALPLPDLRPVLDAIADELVAANPAATMPDRLAGLARAGRPRGAGVQP